MASRQVGDVDEVADSRAVRGIPVCSKNTQMVHFPQHDLEHNRHQIGRRHARIFAQQARFITPNRIEVPQCHNRPGGICKSQVRENGLTHPLGPPVGIGQTRAARQRSAGLVVAVGPLCLGMRAKLLREAAALVGKGPVDGRRGGEDEGFDVEGGERAAEADEAADVVVVVLERVLDALGDGLVRSEVDDSFDRGTTVASRISPENLLHLAVVSKISLVEMQVWATQVILLDMIISHPIQRVENGGEGVAQVVNNDNIVTILEKFPRSMAADVAQAAHDQHVLVVVWPQRSGGGELAEEHISLGTGGTWQRVEIGQGLGAGDRRRSRVSGTARVDGRETKVHGAENHRERTVRETDP